MMLTVDDIQMAVKNIAPLNIRKKVFGAAAAVLLAGVVITGCSGVDANGAGKATGILNEDQMAAVGDIISAQTEPEQAEKIDLPAETAAKFPALVQAFKIVSEEEIFYVFEVAPTGYRSDINILVVIDPAADEVTGIRIMEQDETPTYAGNYLQEDWFSERFRNKSTDTYLVRSVLEAEYDNEIIQITGASVSSQAVVNGVNTAMGAYREIVLGESPEAVGREVEGFVTGVRR